MSAIRAAALLLGLLAASCGGSRDPERDRWRDGMTEILFAFEAKGDPGRHVSVDPAVVRAAVRDTGVEVFDAQSVIESLDGGVEIACVLLRVPLVRPDAAAQEDAVAALRARFGDAIDRATWSGNRLFVRATRPLPEAELRELLARAGFAVAAVQAPSDLPDEFVATITVAGPEATYQRAIERRLDGVAAIIVSIESVGPQRRAPAR